MATDEHGLTQIISATQKWDYEDTLIHHAEMTPGTSQLTPDSAMTIFITKRLRVRHLRLSDADNFFALQSNPEVMQYIRPPRTRAESDSLLQEKITTRLPKDFKGYWAVDDLHSGSFVGCFVIIPIPGDEEKTQLGYSFLPQHWGKGYATEVTKEGVNYFYNRTPLTEIYGVTETPNVVSQKVLLKAGFKQIESKWEGEKELLVYMVKKID